MLGELTGSRRATATVGARYGLTRNADAAEEDLPARARDLRVWAALHTSFRHTEDKPRWRAVFLQLSPA